MATKLLSANEVLKILDVKDFRSIPKDKIIEFVSMIPNMDKDVAMECVKQFPNFKDSTQTMVTQLYSLCDRMIDDDKSNRKAIIESYQKILDDLSILLKRKFLSYKKRQYIIEKMIEVADKIDAINDKQQSFNKNVLALAGICTAFIATVGGAILGVKITKK